MKNLILVFLAVFFCSDCFGQAPTIQWQKCLGGTAYDAANCVQPTPDGGAIVVGESRSINGNVTGNHGNGDYWIVKLNDTGGIQWQKSLGGSGYEVAYAIVRCTDGGYIVAGHTDSGNGDVTGIHGSSDYWVVKINDTGGIQWQKCYGGSGAENAYSIQQTFDGGYIVGGMCTSNNGDVTGHHGTVADYWIVKINDTGAIQWQKSLGGTGLDRGCRVWQTIEGGYIAAGYSDSHDGDVTGNHGGQDYWIVKLNDTGGIQWQKSYGGTSDETTQSIQQTFDGGYIIAGSSGSSDGDVSGHHGSLPNGDCWIVKINDTGGIQWQKCLGGAGEEAAAYIQQTSDSGYIVAGFADSTDGDVTGTHGNYDYWVVKINASGAIQWQESLGGSNRDWISWVQQVNDGYIISGYTASFNGDVTLYHGGNDYWIVKLHCGLSAGTISGLTTVCIGNTLTLTDTATGGVWSVANAHASVVGGVVTGVSAGVDTVYYTKTNSCGSAVASFVVTVTSCPTGVGAVTKPVMTIVPNPTTGIISVSGISNASIKVYNTVGQVVKEGRNTNSVSIAEMSAGLYFVRVWDEDGQLLKVEKVMKLQ